MPQIRSAALWAALLASYDDGDWVALLLEDVEGTHPDLGDDTVMARLLSATEDLTAVMRERVPLGRGEALVGGTLFEPGLTDTRAVMRGWAWALDHVDGVPDAPLPQWVREEARWGDRVLELAARRWSTWSMARRCLFGHPGLGSRHG